MHCSTLQAIEAAIELNLNTVEAGAQGEHKIQRGYLPVTTYSCHYLTEEAFRPAIQDFLEREAAQVAIYPNYHFSRYFPSLLFHGLTFLFFM